MNLLYKSTRNSEKTVTASEAILKGLADDGGLFVPESIPKLDVTLDELKGMSYQETAYAVMKQFFTDFTEEELKHCINSAYDSKFDTEVIAPLVKVGDTYHLELFHGATIAFKDMALSILPHLLITSAKKNNVKNEIVILTATSGDTGKAALAGFADVPTQDSVDAMRKVFEERRNYLVERMNQIEGVSCLKPDGAFYVMMNLEKLIGRTLGGRVIRNADDFAMAFLEKGLVAVVSCCAFDAPNFVRWTYATSLETIKEGLDRLEKFLRGA